MTPLRELARVFSYFTVIPLGRFADGPAPDARALSYLPFVGIVVGAIAGALGWGAGLAFPATHWPAIVAWIACVALTGAIHVDGFLDCADGVLVTASPERRLEIMSDPRHGTFAVVGMAMLAAAWLAALDRVPPALMPAVLAFSGGLARWSVLPNAWVFPYARGGLRADAFVARPRALVALVSFVALAALGWALSPWVIAIAVPALLAAFALARFAAGRLGGGITGDVYGATIVAVEVLVLVLMETVPSGHFAKY